MQMNGILFYDGNCSLCKHEISLLSRYKSEGLRLVNIHSNKRSSLANGRSDLELLRVLHFRTDHGQWLKGLDATVAAWKHTPFGWAFSVLRWPLIKRVADWCYYRWANKRACHLGYC